MSQVPEGGPPVVERTTEKPPAALTERVLHLRIRQQQILTELGVSALQGTDFSGLLEQTARLTAEGLKPNTAKSWNTSHPRTAFSSSPALAGNRELWGPQRSAPICVTSRLCPAHRQACHFKSSRERAAIQNSRASRGAWHSPRDECHLAGRRSRRSACSRSTANPPASSARTICRSYRAPPIFWEWRSSSSIPAKVAGEPRLIATRFC